MGKVKNNPTVKPTHDDWVKMAILLDTEGSIKIYKVKPSKASGAKTIHHSLNLKINNTDPRMAFWCQVRFGGSVMSRRPNRKNREVWEWSIYSQRAENILVGCFQHFIIKREQAEIALRIRATIQAKGRARWQGVSEELFNKREELSIELKRLKHELPEAAKAVIQ